MHLQICETFVLIWNIKSISGWRRSGILTKHLACKHQSWESHKFQNLHCKDFLFHSCDMTPFHINSYMRVFGPVKSELRQNYWRLCLMHSSATYLQSNPFEPLLKHHWCKSKSIPLKTTLRRTYTAALCLSPVPPRFISHLCFVWCRGRDEACNGWTKDRDEDGVWQGCRMGTS